MEKLLRIEHRLLEAIFLNHVTCRHLLHQGVLRLVLKHGLVWWCSVVIRGVCLDLKQLLGVIHTVRHVVFSKFSYYNIILFCI